MPGSTVVGSIVEQIPIDYIDQNLGDVQLAIEIAGIALCVLCGNPLLGCACLKALGHQEVHRVLVTVIKQGIRCLLPDGDSKPSDRSQSPTPALSRHHSNDHTAGSAAEASARTRLADPDHPALTFSLARRAAEPVEVPVKKDKSDGRGRTWSTEKDESSILTDWRPENAIKGLSGTSRGQEELIFVRLKVYYEVKPSAVPTTDGQLDRLMRLVVVREACSVSLFEPSAHGTAHPHVSADRLTEYIEHQLNEAALPKVRQLWRAAHGDGLALESRSVSALQKSLRRLFLSRLTDLEDVGLIAEDISADAVERLIGPGSRCAELVGFIYEVPGNPVVRGVGSKAMLHDEFSNIVISAMTN
jgi:hypothetical protein